MAILSMNKLHLYGLNTQRKAILEELQKSEIVEISEFDRQGMQLAERETTQTVTQINHYMNNAQQALSILDEYAPEKTGLFSSRRSISISKFSMKSTDSDGAMKQVFRIIELSDKLHELKENLRRIDAKQIALTPYLRLNVPMEVTETKHVEMRSGLVAGLLESAPLKAQIDELGIEGVYFEIISASKEQSSVWFAYLKEDADAMNQLYQKIGFQEPAFSLSHHTPQKKVEVLEKAKKDVGKEMEGLVKELQGYDKYRREIELLYDHLAMRKQRYLEVAKAGVTDHAFMLEGFVPQKYAEGLKKKLEEDYSAIVQLSEPEAGEAPILFKNNKFVAPAEGITETYSMPSAEDVDPNPIMSFFYYFFFGMMFSDAGYGIIMAVACAILGYGRVLEPRARKTFQMFFFCGVSTIIWGFLFGGFFGDATYTISTLINGPGNGVVLQPLWLDPTARPLQLLVFSIILGLIQLMIGLGIKLYMIARQGHLADAIMDVGIWLWILFCITCLALTMYMNTAGIMATPEIYATLNNIGLWGLVAGLIGLVCTQGRKEKNPIMKVLKGILSIYDITGYIGDILSYSRLLALGLATGVIASVINLLGAMFAGAGGAGVILFVFIFIFGHIVNFAINALGAYVHTMRLQYVEFYSKFYEGGGRKFVPFSMDTKFYRFSKE